MYLKFALKIGSFCEVIVGYKGVIKNLKIKQYKKMIVVKVYLGISL